MKKISIIDSTFHWIGDKALWNRLKIDKFLTPYEKKLSMFLSPDKNKHCHVLDDDNFYLEYYCGKGFHINYSVYMSYVNHITGPIRHK
jgi:hypothetical protein